MHSYELVFQFAFAFLEESITQLINFFVYGLDLIVVLSLEVVLLGSLQLPNAVRPEFEPLIIQSLDLQIQIAQVSLLL